jgi:hypothetical protein
MTCILFLVTGIANPTLGPLSTTEGPFKEPRPVVVIVVVFSVLGVLSGLPTFVVSGLGILCDTRILRLSREHLLKHGETDSKDDALYIRTVEQGIAWGRGPGTLHLLSYGFPAGKAELGVTPLTCLLDDTLQVCNI